MTKYDLEAYPYCVRPFSHPARVGALAHLYGLAVVPIENCRVLEIGGGNGINVINMAVAAPKSEFVNIDLSSVAIDRGRSLARDIGLTNVTMNAIDIIAAGDELGQFDYVIAHGIYAWVPEPVRKEIMALIGRILTPRGVALVSYNSGPGCHIRRAIRDLIHSAAAPYQTAEERTRISRDVLTFYCKHWDPRVAAQAVFLGESERILRGRNNVLFHDELSDDWHPQFLSDVVAEARKNGLEYLGDSQLELIGPALFPDSFSKDAKAIVGSDFAALEQMRDFRDARSFRITLLCRAGIPIERCFRANRLEGLYVDGAFNPIGPAARNGKPFGWTALSGLDICTSDERLNVLCMRLNEAWPQAVSIDAVAADEDMKVALGKLFTTGGVGLVRTPYALTVAPGDRPMVSRVARAQVAIGAVEVSTLRHTQVRLDDELTLAFVAALDGTRNRDTLIEMIRLRSDAGDDQMIASNVEKMIAQLAKYGLMER